MLADAPGILLDGAWIGGPPLDVEGGYFAKNPIGQMVEQAIHTVDVVHYLCEVTEVFAFATTGSNKKLPNIVSNYNLDDAMVLSLKCASGMVGNLMS